MFQKVREEGVGVKGDGRDRMPDQGWPLSPLALILAVKGYQEVRGEEGEARTVKEWLTLVGQSVCLS